mmetsp:Transcript_37412/g.117848  ORF Transcript_37412/g.117848 Transcript_37412/m.117848 type:complete len:245 (+) Transcript_37412:626-1360(+)
MPLELPHPVGGVQHAHDPDRYKRKHDERHLPDLQNIGGGERHLRETCDPDLGRAVVNCEVREVGAQAPLLGANHAQRPGEGLCFEVPVAAEIVERIRGLTGPALVLVKAKSRKGLEGLLAIAEQPRMGRVPPPAKFCRCGLVPRPVHSEPFHPREPQALRDGVGHADASFRAVRFRLFIVEHAARHRAPSPGLDAGERNIKVNRLLELGDRQGVPPRAVEREGDDGRHHIRRRPGGRARVRVEV